MKRLFESDDDDENKNKLAESIAENCYHQYDQLISGGKPSNHQWTHLAGFVSVDQDEHVQVLSLGTGTKCLGGQIEERGRNGCLLHDSHAEVIARRALLRLFYEEILSKKMHLFIRNENHYDFNPLLKLYFFVSSSPCGLASHRSNPMKKPKLEHKILKSEETGEELFLKPGKGSATQSLSCTDKIKRWIFQGIEGRLLNQIIKSPIRLSGLIIVSETDLSDVFPSIPVYSIDRRFRDGPSESRTCPSSISLAWWLSLDCSSSISTVDGYPLGQIRRLRHQANYANPLAKVSLFRLYLQLIDTSDKNRITYGDAKSRSTNDLREQFLEKHPLWIITDPTLFYSFTAQL